MVTIARMYDFESVSVSSFEAASLAATLTEKSADGWDVVAIVNAGSNVVAYLRRAGDSAAASVDADGSTADTTDTAAAESTSDSAAAVELLTPTSVSSEPSVPTADTSSTSAADTGDTGWGAGSDTTAAAAAGAGWEGTSESSSWSGSAQQTTTPTTPSVPAGWYADPAGRFELRYWDGTAWTEHVSRGGQQYTDPPVA
jgi:hypothetical protein